MSTYDITLTCRDCSTDFVWTSGEQEFYQSKGLAKRPSRCPNCRSAGRPHHVPKHDSRPMYDVICCDCGESLRLPFQPKNPSSFRCKNCKEIRESRMHTVTCSYCGTIFRIPFAPDPSRPIYCRDCKAAGKKVMYEALCAHCGETVSVPFEPDESRPFKCKDCRDMQAANRRFGGPDYRSRDFDYGNRGNRRDAWTYRGENKSHSSSERSRNGPFTSMNY